MTFLLSIGQWIANKAWPYLAGAAALLLLLAKAKRSGADAEQAKQLRNTVKSVETAHDVENSVRAADPVELGELRRKWTKPR